MTPEDAVINYALSQIGYVEKPGNLTKYGAWYGLDGNPWCAMFLAYCLDTCGIKPFGPRPKGFALVQEGVNYSKTVGRWSAYPKRGAYAVFQFDGDPQADHIGLLVGWDNHYVTTIDGNSNEAGSSNGGMVVQKTRPRSLVMGYIYPNFEDWSDMPLTTDDIIKIVKGVIGQDAYNGVGNTAQQVNVMLTRLNQLETKLSAKIDELEAGSGTVDYDVLAGRLADKLADRFAT